MAAKNSSNGGIGGTLNGLIVDLNRDTEKDIAKGLEQIVTYYKKKEAPNAVVGEGVKKAIKKVAQEIIETRQVEAVEKITGPYHLYQLYTKHQRSVPSKYVSKAFFDYSLNIKWQTLPPTPLPPTPLPPTPLPPTPLPPTPLPLTPPPLNYPPSNPPPPNPQPQNPPPPNPQPPLHTKLSNSYSSTDPAERKRLLKIHSRIHEDGEKFVENMTEDEILYRLHALMAPPLFGIIVDFNNDGVDDIAKALETIAHTRKPGSKEEIDPTLKTDMRLVAEEIVKMPKMITNSDKLFKLIKDRIYCDYSYVHNAFLASQYHIIWQTRDGYPVVNPGDQVPVSGLFGLPNINLNTDGEEDIAKRLQEIVDTILLPANQNTEIGQEVKDTIRKVATVVVEQQQVYNHPIDCPIQLYILFLDQLVKEIITDFKQALDISWASIIWQTYNGLPKFNSITDQVKPPKDGGNNMMNLETWGVEQIAERLEEMGSPKGEIVKDAIRKVATVIVEDRRQRITNPDDLYKLFVDKITSKRSTYLSLTFRDSRYNIIWQTKDGLPTVNPTDGWVGGTLNGLIVDLNRDRKEDIAQGLEQIVTYYRCMKAPNPIVITYIKEIIENVAQEIIEKRQAGRQNKITHPKQLYQLYKKNHQTEKRYVLEAFLYYKFNIIWQTDDGLPALKEDGVFMNMNKDNANAIAQKIVEIATSKQAPKTPVTYQKANEDSVRQIAQAIEKEQKQHQVADEQKGIMTPQHLLNLLAPNIIDAVYLWSNVEAAFCVTKFYVPLEAKDVGPADNYAKQLFEHLRNNAQGSEKVVNPIELTRRCSEESSITYERFRKDADDGRLEKIALITKLDKLIQLIQDEFNGDIPDYYLLALHASRYNITWQTDNGKEKTDNHTVNISVDLKEGSKKCIAERLEEMIGILDPSISQEIAKDIVERREGDRARKITNLNQLFKLFEDRRYTSCIFESLYDSRHEIRWQTPKGNPMDIPTAPYWTIDLKRDTDHCIYEHLKEIFKKEKCKSLPTLNTSDQKKIQKIAESIVQRQSINLIPDPIYKYFVFRKQLWRYVSQELNDRNIIWQTQDGFPTVDPIDMKDKNLEKLKYNVMTQIFHRVQTIPSQKYWREKSKSYEDDVMTRMDKLYHGVQQPNLPAWYKCHKKTKSEDQDIRAYLEDKFRKCHEENKQETISTKTNVAYFWTVHLKDHMTTRDIITSCRSYVGITTKKINSRWTSHFTAAKDLITFLVKCTTCPGKTQSIQLVDIVLALAIVEELESALYCMFANAKDVGKFETKVIKELHMQDIDIGLNVISGKKDQEEED